MIRKLILGLLVCVLCFSAELKGQKAIPNTNLPTKVNGLELPDVVLVNQNNQFTTVQAKTKGQVKWLVMSEKNIKYIEDSENNKIILGTIPENCAVTIIAVANVDGKTTDFACTKVQNKKSDMPKKEIQDEKLDYRIRWH